MHEIAGTDPVIIILLLVRRCCFYGANATAIWARHIRPTLLRPFAGRRSPRIHTNGIDEDNFFWDDPCNLPEYGFTEYHAPSHSNPFLPSVFAKVLRGYRAPTITPLVYAHTYLAELVDWSGIAFFSLGNLPGRTDKPCPYPARTLVCLCINGTRG